MDRRVHVLLVDDEADCLDPVAFWLDSKGYGITTASSGEEALRKIEADPPDIVFLDIRMPGMDGIETLRRIRAQSGDLPVVMVTAAYQEDELFKSARELGVSGFFPKQNDLSQLAGFIETSLRAHAKLKRHPG